MAKCQRSILLNILQGARTAVQLTVHDDAKSFLVATGALLRAAEAENSIIATPAWRMATAPRDDDGDAYFASVADGGTVVAAALYNRSSGGVLLTAGPEAAFGLIAADIAQRGCQPGHLVGAKASCEAFTRNWGEHTGETHVLRFHLRHFELTASPPSVTARGSMRLPHPTEHGLIADWQIAFVEEVDMPNDHTRMRSMIARRLDEGLIRVWDDGGMVAYAGYSEAGGTEGAGDTARIAPVYTPPHWRSRGYASALVAALSRELFDEGKRALFITTDVANPTSNSIYQKIGYRAVADHFHFDLVSRLPDAT